MTDSRFPRDHLTRRNAPSYPVIAIIFGAAGLLACVASAAVMWGVW